MTSPIRAPLLRLAPLLLAVVLGACGSDSNPLAGSTPGVGPGPRSPDTSPFVLAGPDNASPSTTNPAFDPYFRTSTSTTTTAPPPTTLPGGAAPIGTDDAVCREVNALVSRAIGAGQSLERGTSVAAVAEQVAAALRDAASALDRVAGTSLGDAPQTMARRIGKAAERIASIDDASLLQRQLAQIFRSDGGSDDRAIRALTAHLDTTCPEQLDVFR